MLAAELHRSGQRNPGEAMTGTGSETGHGGGEDGALAHLHAAAEAYRREREATAAELAATREALARAEAEVREARSRAEKAHADAERRREQAAHLREAASALHRAVFAGDVYALILRACLSITGATRGLYVTWRSERDHPRVRAAVDVGEYPGAPASPYVVALCRRVLDEQRTLVCNAPGALEGLPAPDEPAERFRSCVVAPVVLLRDLNGIVIAADKAQGDFDEADVETLLSVGNHAAVAVENRHLEQQLQSAYVSTVSMLADAVEAKDPYTHGHCEMVSRYARLIAEGMGLEEHARALVCYSALLHDVGKIGVSDGVLNKPGPLLPEERELMRAHVRVGHDLLCNIPALREVADVVLHHHEWWDGSGYPDGLRGPEVPVPARIVSVVDAYCAMVTRRSYKEAYTAEHARAELSEGAGRQFDPEVVRVFLRVLDSPESEDQDEDYEAECGLLPSFVGATAGLPPLLRSAR
jgi:HD-GYP domain-containing protein (c-di-GMP phosphodiesterase class II)